MKLIIAGGRDYILTEADYAWLASIPDVTEVVSGGAKGADEGGERFAAMHGLPLAIFTPDWQKYGKGAGPRRNREMAQYADALALFPGGAGSANMRSNALKMGLKIYERV